MMIDDAGATPPRICEPVTTNSSNAVRKSACPAASLPSGVSGSAAGLGDTNTYTAGHSHGVQFFTARANASLSPADTHVVALIEIAAEAHQVDQSLLGAKFLRQLIELRGSVADDDHLGKPQHVVNALAHQT
jgi:hypothetical protein